MHVKGGSTSPRLLKLTWSRFKLALLASLLNDFSMAGSRLNRSRNRSHDRDKGGKSTHESAKLNLSHYKSVTFRPNSLSYEVTLNRLYVGTSAACLVLSIVVVTTAFIYRNAYKDGGDSGDQISQEQDPIMGWSENAWILAACACLACGGAGACEFVSQCSATKRYEHWNKDGEDSSDEEDVIDELDRPHLKTRYMAYAGIMLGFTVGYFYLSIRTWNEGSHAEVKTWPKRKTFKYKYKDTPREEKIEMYKKVLQINHPECTAETLSFCSEIKQFNYTLIAATVFHALLLMVICFIIYRARSGANRGKLESLTEKGSRRAKGGKWSGGRDADGE